MARGLTLGDVIQDWKTKKFSFESSQLFWFSVLRKIYVHSRDPLKAQSREDYLRLKHYLEEKLAKDSEELEKLVRTSTIFLATEHGDSNTVESLVTKMRKGDFFTYFLIPPGLLFPPNSYGGGPMRATPVAVALKQLDVKLLSVLRSGHWGRVRWSRSKASPRNSCVLAMALPAFA